MQVNICHGIHNTLFIILSVLTFILFVNTTARLPILQSIFHSYPRNRLPLRTRIKDQVLPYYDKLTHSVELPKAHVPTIINNVLKKYFKRRKNRLYDIKAANLIKPPTGINTKWNDVKLQKIIIEPDVYVHTFDTNGTPTFAYVQLKLILWYKIMLTKLYKKINLPQQLINKFVEEVDDEIKNYGNSTVFVWMDKYFKYY